VRTTLALVAAVAGALAAGLAGCGRGDGAAAPAAGTAAPEVDPDLGHANLILISLDTLRADCTSIGAGPEAISPALARFASEATVFTQARAQAPHTAPSHMSLFTSALPSVHGVQNVANTTAADGSPSAVIEPMRGDVPTLAQILQAAGFRTIGLTDGGNLIPNHGFGRGFDTYTYKLEGAAKKVDEGLLACKALSQPGAGRFFLFLHTYQIHAPYVPPPEYIERWAPRDYEGPLRERIETLSSMSLDERWAAMRSLFWKDRDSFGGAEAGYLRGLYQGGVRYTDDELGRLFEGLQRSGLLDTSIVVVLSDHGEEFHEHGRWQHEQLYEECLRVPLVVRLPHGYRGGRRIDVPVGLVDVMPTMLDLLGIDVRELALPGPVRHDGRTLVTCLVGGPPPPGQPVVSEHIATRGGNYEHQLLIRAGAMAFLYDEYRGEKLPDGSVQHRVKLWDLAADPLQEHDLAADSPQIVKQFELLHAHYREAADADRATATSEPAQPLDDEQRRQLEELGYIGGGDGGAGKDR
jgi:choline-sulfatase